MPKRTIKLLAALALAAGLARTAIAAESIDTVCSKAGSEPTLI